MNPTIATEVLLFAMGAYTNTDNKLVTADWKFYNMERYTWVYVVAPFTASILAGLFANLSVKHLNAERDGNRENLIEAHKTNP